jgi:hypothetical protein
MIFVCGDSNQSLHPVLERGIQSDFWKTCELRQEMPFLKDRNIPSDNNSYARIERNMIMLNQENRTDDMQFSDNFAHKILETDWLYGVWHCLHEWRDEPERIPDAIQELVIESIRCSWLH